MTSSPDAGWALPELPGDPRHSVVDPAEVARRQEYERGYADGFADAQERAREALGPALEALGDTVAALAAAREEFLRDQARNIEGLAVGMAQHVIQREVQADPSLLQALVERALALLPRDTAFTIYLNPEDYATVADQLDAAAGNRGEVKVKWMADPSLDRGGFLMQTPARIVDGRTDVALQRLYERLAYD
ncbi:MAG: FliH/SctL family protein [Gemmatimonadales bacterium]